jgi:hypothetical protein
MEVCDYAARHHVITPSVFKSGTSLLTQLLAGYRVRKLVCTIYNKIANVAHKTPFPSSTDMSQAKSSNYKADLKAPARPFCCNVFLMRKRLQALSRESYIPLRRTDLL